MEAGTLQTGGRSALAVVRYDRTFMADGSVRRLHQEDFTQALGFLPTQKYERGPLPGPSLKDILGMGGKDWATKHGVSSGLSGQERSRILDQVIFNVFVANTDAHAKNYALLLNGGHARLTPLYDVSCALPWKHMDQDFAQKLAGKKRRPGDVAPRHWDAIARDSGFDASHVRERVVRLADRIFRSGPETASKVAAMPGVHLGTVNLVRDMVQSNALRIMGRIESSARSAPRPVSVQGDHDPTLG